MKISLDWLKELVEIKKNPKELALDISEHCFEVEKIGTSEGVKFSNVYVAKVLSWEKHPNADRLRIVHLDLGDRQVGPVVCGAANFDKGDLVALALPGAFIPKNIHSDTHESYTLGKATIRGIESQGMICSAFELGLADKPEEKPEIKVFSGGTKVGEDLAKAYGSGDSEVLEVALPANRPDLHSHLGVARELSAILGYKITKKFAELEKGGKITSKGKIDIELDSKGFCDFYLGAKLKVKVGDSPKELKEKLQAVGMRSINNVVDITNYVMVELGQPLHAFDASQVNSQVLVRRAKNNEKLMTLDHKERVLNPDIYVIADNNKALAIAGIIGGAQSEVKTSTQEIILEAANFNAAQIRKMSKILNLRTDASALWEKGIHANQALLGMYRAIALLKKYAGAEMLSFGSAGNIASSKRVIKFSTEQINRLLGTNFDSNSIKKHISNMGFKCTGTANLDVEIPYYRLDIEDAAGIAEEILKVIGPNKIEKVPLQIIKTSKSVDEVQPYNYLKEKIVGLGFNEIQSYSFTSEAELNKLGKNSSGYLKIKNPLSSETELLKQEMIGKHLNNIAHNSKFFSKFNIFEIGKTYHGFMNEPDWLALSIYSKKNNPEMLLAEMKGSILSLGDIKFKPAGKKLAIVGNNKEMGEVQIVPAKILRAFDIEGVVVFAQIKIESVFDLSREVKFKEFNKYPESILDISLVVNEEVSWAQIEDVVLQNGQGLVHKTEPFEAAYLYDPDKLPEFHRKLAQKSQKNIAFHVVYSAKNRTLKDSEILPIHAKILEGLSSKLKAEIR